MKDRGELLRPLGPGDLRVGDCAIHHEVALPLSDVLIEHQPGFDPVLTPQDLLLAEQRWLSENARRVGEGLPALHDGRLFSPRVAGFDGNQWILAGGLGSYRLNRTLGREVRGWTDNFVLGSGLSVVPVSADRRILIGKRSRATGEAQGLYHVCGGHVHPGPEFSRRREHVLPWALEELEEEMHVTRDDLRSLVYCGLFLNCTNAKPEIVAFAELSEDAEEYVRRFEKSPCDEFDHLTTLDRLSPEFSGPADSLSSDSLAAGAPLLTVSGFGALLLFVRRMR